MILRHRAFGRIGATALLALGAVAAAGAPAPAAPTEADLSIRGASGRISVGVSGKAFRLDLKNAGPAVAPDTMLTLDLSGLDTERVDIDVAQFDGCATAGQKIVCEMGEGGVGETLSLLLHVERLGGVGPAGSFTAVVESSASDPDEGDNLATIPVEIVGGGPDLLAYAADVYTLDGEQGEPVPPGGSAPLFWFLANQGDRAAKGIDLTIHLPEHVSFVGTYEDCVASSDAREITCVFKDVVIEPGGAIFPPNQGTLVKVADDAPGPVALDGGLVKGHALGSVDPSVARSPTTSVAPTGLRVGTTEQAREAGDVDEGDNDANFAVFVAAPAAAGGGGAGGGLPLTGVQTGVIGGTGLVVVVAGVVLFLLARRREVVLVTPADETSNK